MLSSDSQLNWLELALTAPAEEAPFLEHALLENGFEGWVVEVEEPQLRWILYLPQEGRWRERLENLKGLARVEQRNQVKDADWAENWKEFYHPVRVGQRLVVCPSWESFTPRSEDVVITLDPGSAFGTGYHETTRLCLESLERLAPLGTVLDCGCGSGILSIAAAKLGANRVVAFDRDPVAVRVARENVAINQVEVLCEQRDQPPQALFDLVVANITASALLAMRDLLLEATGRQLILSGIIEERAQDVVDGFRQAGLKLTEQHQDGEWVSLVWTR